MQFEFTTYQAPIEGAYSAYVNKAFVTLARAAQDEGWEIIGANVDSAPGLTSMILFCRRPKDEEIPF